MSEGYFFLAKPSNILVTFQNQQIFGHIFAFRLRSRISNYDMSILEFSRSLGPVVEAAQRELLASAAAARERSRSRGPMETSNNSGKKENLNRSKSKNRFDDQEDNLSGGSSSKRQPYRSKESSSLESSRGRSRMKNNVERSVSSSNKKPIKVDVMDPFLGVSNPNLGNPHLGMAPGSRMPARQKSMIDLRDPNASLWSGTPHDHLHGPPQHHLHQMHHHSRHHHQIQMMQNHGKRLF